MKNVASFRAERRQLLPLIFLPALAFPWLVDLHDAPSDGAPPVIAECVGLSVEHLDAEKVSVAARMKVTARQDLKLDQVTLTNLHLNGLPVFAAPVLTPLHLVKAQTSELPQPIVVTIYLRDLSSTAPLEQALQDGFATVDGELYLSVHLGVLAKIVLHSSQATVPLKLREQVPLNVPGGSLAKRASIATLQAADLALKHLNAGATPWMGFWPGLRRDALQQYAGSTFAVAATYVVEDHEGKEIPLTWSGIAFRIAPTEIALPDEAMEPWSFDPEIGGGLQAGKLKLKPGSFRLSLWPAGQVVTGPLSTDGGLQLGKQVVAYGSQSQAATDMMIPGDPHSLRKARIYVRSSDANVAFLTPNGSLPDSTPIKFAHDPLPAKWDSLALLRFPRLGSGTLAPEVILTSGYLDHGRIRLAVSVDSTVFGSPIVSPDGVVGMVQDESTGTAWNEIADRVRGLNGDAFPRHD